MANAAAEHHKNKYKERRKKARMEIGIPRHANLPKCPARSWSKAKKLNTEQDPDWEGKKQRGELPEDFVDHTATNHFCYKCACNKTAGEGTDHLGYGWCYKHEESPRRKTYAEDFAIKHRDVLRQRVPWTYSDTRKWLKKVQKESDESEGRVDLRGEMDLVRSLLQEVQENKPDVMRQEIVNELRELRKGADKDVLDELTKLEDKIDKQLKYNEWIKGVNQTANTVAKLAKEQHLFDSTEYVELDQMKIWLAQITTATKRFLLDEKEYEKWCEIMRQIPLPKTHGMT